MLASYDRIRGVFLEAVRNVPRDRWEAYLDEACLGESDMRQQVRKLLDAHIADGTFPRGNHLVAAETSAATNARELPGALIGPYKLLEQIGEGGMGLVYMAEQQQPVRRLVALKLVKPGMDTKQVIARFEAERQALAMMDHPNIAKVHDAGTTEAGRPYFAMELVRGIPINEFCDQQKLNVRQRLELFSQVCQAVQHAHQKGIIHRDLKPTNVLVTNADTIPLPKVIDFGIAKALGPALTDHTLHTGFAQLVGTPMYMSPEQAQMNHFGVDTRSDVYSLGVLLYELLTGTTPFDKETLSKAGLDEMRRMIREDDPPRPSARMSTLQAQALTTISQQRNIDPRRISATLRGELDWIVMKALEKDRSRRYESASAFAADIQRYLSDEPVLACPPTAMYRFQKFARKHKPALVTAAATALCLLLGTTVSAWQAVRATQAETEANAKGVEAQASAQKAEEKAQEATQQRNEAQQQRDEAQRQRDEVKALNDKLVAKDQQLQRTLYAANMTLARHAWDESAVTRVQDLLEQYRPKPGEADLRGFEWHYLQRLCRSELLTIKGFEAAYPAPHCIALSSDGKRLAGIAGKSVKVWDAQSGQELLALQGTGFHSCVTYSPDGKRLATGSGNSIKVWDENTGEELFALTGPANYVVSSVSFSPDGKRLASGSTNWNQNSMAGEVKVWDAESRRELVTFPGYSNWIVSVAFSPDGKRLATGDWDNTVKSWDAQTGQELFAIKKGGWNVTFSPDGKRLACAIDNSIKFWDSQTGQELGSIQETTGQLNSAVAYSPDGKRLAAAVGDRSVRVWDSETGKELINFKGHGNIAQSVTFSPDGTRLASAARDRTIKIWNATAGPEARPFSGPTRVFTMAFRPDGKCLATASWDNTVKVWDAQAGHHLQTLEGHTGKGKVECIVYSPDGRRLATASTDKTVKVWNTENGREVATCSGHTNGVYSVAFSPDSKRLISCSSNRGNYSLTADAGEPGEVIVWDAISGQELFRLNGHRRFVECVAYSPDGNRLATISRDETVRIWDAQSGQELLSLKAKMPFFGTVAFSPDGKRLAANCRREDGERGPGALGEIKVWDVQTGQELLILKGHNANVMSLVYSRDGKRLASGSGSMATGNLGEVKVWDAESGHELLTLKGGAWFHRVAFSPDGNWLLSNAGDELKIYNATPLLEKP